MLCIMLHKDYKRINISHHIIFHQWKKYGKLVATQNMLLQIAQIDMKLIQEPIYLEEIKVL